MALGAGEGGAVHLRAHRKQTARRGLEARCNLQSHTDRNLLPPIRSHFPKFPEPPKTALPAGTKCSKHGPVGDISHLNRNGSRGSPVWGCAFESLGQFKKFVCL
jgi:hypothetical protein